MKHTAGEWRAKDYMIYSFDESGKLGNHICNTANNAKTRTLENEANAARIVQCVNGCQGIRDPSAVGELVEAVEAARDEIIRIASEFTNSLGIDPQSNLVAMQIDDLLSRLKEGA